MVMSVITNISSLNAQKNLATSQSKLATAISRLSSGMRINSAKDDAAGLAISTRFTTQINGLNQAVSNANDGISLAQTTESALNEVTNNMQRIRTLAVQSANATNSDSDRAALDAEVQQRLSEITRISQQTTFNGRHVLDGTFGNAAFQIGANVGETISVNLSQGAGASQVGQIATSKTGDISSQFASPAGLTLAAGDLTVQMGSGAAANVAAGNYADAASLITAINTAAGSTIAAASGSEIVFSNSSTTDTITFGGSAASALGMSTVGVGAAGATATAASVDSAAVISSFNFADSAATASVATVTGVAGFDYSGTAENFTIDGNAVAMTTAYANQGAMVTDVQSQLDTAAGAGVYTVAADGATGFTITTTAAGASSAIVVGGADSSFVTSNVDGADAVTRSKSFSIDGTTVNLNTDVTNMAGLIGAINTALGGSATNYALSDDGGKLKIATVATGSSASIAIGGTDGSTFFAAAVAGADPGATVNGTATTTGVDAAVSAPSGGAATLALSTGDLTIGGTDMAGSYDSAQELVDAINSKGIAGVSAYYDAEAKSVHLNSQSDLVVDGAKAGTGELDFSNAGSAVIATGSNLAASDVLSVVGANDTISRIDSALGTVSSMRSDLGAVQNRFDSTIANLQTISQNLSSSRSQIQDADFAAETANMSSANILQQAGVSVLAQANASTQSVLKLLQ
jgi:flagellin